MSETASHAADPVILILTRRPKSYNARGLRAFQRWVAEQAALQVPTTLAGERLYSKIYYFHRKVSTADADNLSKPLLDALKGIVYADDIQVVHRTIARIQVGTDIFSIDNKPEYVEEFDQLMKYLDTQPDVLYIEIGTLDNFKLTLTAGPT